MTVPRISVVAEGHLLTQEMLRETNKKLDELTARVDLHGLALTVLTREGE